MIELPISGPLIRPPCPSPQGSAFQASGPASGMLQLEGPPECTAARARYARFIKKRLISDRHNLRLILPTSLPAMLLYHSAPLQFVPSYIKVTLTLSAI